MSVDPPPALRAPEAIRIAYVPQPGLLGTAIANFVLGILTLTVYRFWGRTNVRRHIWNCVHINGQPLEYTGKGIELFKGALFVFLVFGLPTALLFSGVGIALGPDHPALAGLQMLLFLAVGLLWGAALYRARRYQLSRTLWRGIRATLAGSATSYALLYFGAMLARGMTLGWVTPIMNLNLQRMMIGDMRFGDRPFRLRGEAGPLYPSYAVCWFLTLLLLVGFVALVGYLIDAHFGDDLARLFGDSPQPPAGDDADILVFLVAGLGIYLLFGALYPVVWAFYTARELALFASYTSFETARFRFDATAGSLIALAVSNLLLWVLTLGIAAPFVQQRLIRYMCERLTVEGAVDIDSIRQSQAPVDSMGEGLADALDVGGI